MDRVALLVFALVALAALAVSMWRATELFVLGVKQGNVRVVRGRLPPTLLSDLRDVLERTSETGRVRVTVVRGVATVTVSGTISEPTTQRLRNVIGAVPLQRIRTGGGR